MQISIGTKHYTFTGDATPSNIAQQISDQESGVNTKKLTEKLAQVVFGAPYRKHDVIDAHLFTDGTLNLKPGGFEKILGALSSGGSSRVVLVAPSPKVVIQRREPEAKKMSSPPSVPPSDSLYSASRLQGCH